MTRLIAVASISAIALLPALPAHAATTADQIAATNRAITSTAQRWFTAQADAARIDAGIASVEHEIAADQANLNHIRVIATARAVVMYQNAATGVPAIFGDDALDSARRAELVNDADAGGDAAIAQLTAAVDNLNAQQRSLVAQRAQLAKTLHDVSKQRVALDNELAAVRAQARHDALVALDTARSAAARAAAAARVRALADVNQSNSFAAPTGPPTSAAVISVVLTAPADSGRVSPHHDDPFLVCTRARESDGEYNAVSPSGYYGAYQFLPSTWDITAVHEGRPDLVGVLPSRASEYDQDQTAWTLYQWQGKGPWGGRC